MKHMPSWIPEIRRRLADAGLEPAREAEIAQELAQHLDDRYAEMRALGHSEEEARRAALEELRDARMLSELRQVTAMERAAPPLGGPARGSFVAGLWQDARYGLRLLRRNPGFSALAVLTLAIGVGATTIVYAVVDHALLRSLPYPHADRLVRIFASQPSSERLVMASYPNFLDWRARSQTIEFSAVTASPAEPFILVDGPTPVRAPSNATTPDLFAVFDGTPVLGRGFTEADMAIGAERVTIISHGAWVRRFGGDPSVVGRTVPTVAGTYRVVGVLPETFAYARTVDFWVPFKLTPVTKRRDAGMYNVFARLRPGVTLEQARTEMDGIAAALAAEYPENKNSGALVLPMHEHAVGHLRPTLKLLSGAAACILLIGCVNVAGLLVARGAGRTYEIAVRASLGAPPGRIARQLATESLVLSIVGGGVGALLAWWTVSAVLPLLALSLPREVAPSVDLRVLAVAILGSLATGLLFGVAPAMQLARRGVDALREGTRATSAWARRAGAGLVLVQVALSLVLSIGAGLLVRSLHAMTAIDPGIDTSHTLMLTASPLLPRDAAPERRDEFYRSLLDRVSAVSGVETAAAIDTAPFEGASFAFALMADGAKRPVSPRHITPGYFNVMGMQLLAGRDFSAADRTGAPCVAVINDVGARQLFAGASPLGQQVQLATPKQSCEVVGVVSNVRHMGPFRDMLAEVYLPALQQSGADLIVVARAADPRAIAPGVLAQVAHASERALPGRVTIYADSGAEFTADARNRATLFSVLALIGTALGAVGVFSLTAYLVAMRTKEIGVRIALGASAGRVVWTVVRALLPPITIGVAAGIVASWWATKTIKQFLYGVTPTDPLTFAAVAVSLAVVALLASYVPARRALRVDPVQALRAE